MRIHTILVFAALPLLLGPSIAAADTGAFVGYRGAVDVCVSVSDTGGASLDPADCEGGTDALPAEFVGEIAVGVRAGSVELCLLLDDDGNVHPTCGPCVDLDVCAGVMRNAALA